MLDWLENEINVSNKAMQKLQHNRAALHAMKVQPTLAVGKANVAALQQLLHISDKQVRSGHTRAQSGACARFCI